MAGTTRRRTQEAKPQSERRSRVKGAKARLTAQRPSETKGTERQTAAEKAKRPESSASVLDGARPERAQRGKEKHRAKGLGAPESGHLKPIHEEAPLRGGTLLELCMSNPSFRAKVISRLIRKLR